MIVKGDYAGRVSGAIYDISNSTNPIAIPTTPAWEACKLVRRRRVSATQTAMRRLLAAYTQAHKVRKGERIGTKPGVRYTALQAVKGGAKG